MQNSNIKVETLPFKQIINELSNENLPILNAKLVGLSGLNRQQLNILNKVLKNIDVRKRQWIIKRLCELAEDDVSLDFNEIFKGCLRDEDEDVRYLAIEGLWENVETSLIEPLISLTEHDSSHKVQSAAALALGRFTLLAEHQKISKDYVPRLSQFLISTLNDNKKPIDVRCRSLEAVAPLSLPEVKHVINDSYNNDNPMLKTSSIYAMGRNCAPYWLPILLSELSTNDYKMRYEAVVSCGELGMKEAIPYLIEITNDDDADIRMASVQALGKIGGNEAQEHLKKCIEHHSEAMHQATIQALHELEMITEPLYPGFSDYEEIYD
jgi:HEAT repeat protein